jgi:hypothetical protein
MMPSPDSVHFTMTDSRLFRYTEASTEVFHEWVRVYYCREHYQQARSQVDNSHSITANLYSLHFLDSVKERGK